MKGQFASQKIEVELARSMGAETIAGIDEVGRGAVAGPLVTCCYVRSSTTELPQVRDSKLLAPKKRLGLIQDLLDASDAWSLGVVTADEITAKGMAWAIPKCFNRALYNISLTPDLVLYDGPPLQLNHQQKINIINGDETHATIASASIVAKVIRDLFMLEIDEEFPHYHFASHKGYGTKEHLDAISTHGQIPGIHRKTFIH